MTIYSQTEKVYKGLPYAFRCRVFGKYDKEFIETSPNRVNKSYTDLTDYDGFHYTTEMKSTINAIQYGNPTISDTGIASGFATTRYLTITSPDLTAVSKWRVYSKIYITTLDKYQFWFQSPIAIGLDKTNHMHVWRLPSGNVASDFTFSANTWYWVLFEFTGSAYKGYYKTAETDEWTEIINVASTDKITYTDTETYIGLNPNNTSEYFYGSIDLTEERLEIGSEYFPDVWNTAWTGATEQFKVYDFSQTILPWKWEYQNKLQVSRYCLSSTDQSKTYYSNQINGTITGTLTTSVDRAMSGFSGSNYLKLPNAFMPASNTWEIVWKVKTGSSVTTQQFLFGSSTGFFNTVGGELMASGKFGVGISTNGTSWDVGWMGGATVVTANTWYWLKISFNGTEYKLELSTDGETFNLEKSITSSTTIYQNASTSIMHLGTMGNKTTYWGGSLDLGESYIKIGDSIWWRGMNKETVPSMLYGKTIGTTNNVYVINGDESLSAEDGSQPLDTSATNPRFLGTI